MAANRAEMTTLETTIVDGADSVDKVDAAT
jgi:hypothetical protein